MICSSIIYELLIQTVCGWNISIFISYCAVTEDHKVLVLSNMLLQYHFRNKESEMSSNTKTQKYHRVAFPLWVLVKQ